MNGLQIRSKYKFKVLFEPIFPLVKNFQCLLTNQIFSYSDDWYDQSIYDDSSESYISGPIFDFQSGIQTIENEKNNSVYGYSLQFDLLSKNSDFIQEDWCNIYCMRTTLENPKDWFLKLSTNCNEIELIENTIDIAIFNFDGEFWEIYSKDKEILNILKDHIAKQLNTEFELCNLRDFKCL